MHVDRTAALAAACRRRRAAMRALLAAARLGAGRDVIKWWGHVLLPLRRLPPLLAALSAKLVPPPLDHATT